MNLLWPALIAVAFVCAACTGKTAELSSAVVASGAETMAFLLRLTGVLCVWGGLAAVAEKSGLAALCGRALSPLLRLVFPRLKDEKARAAIALNISANFLGLGNAATPLGIAAMKRLRELNGADAVASDEMVRFVVMNSAAVHLVPATVALLRGEAGSPAPTATLLPALIVSLLALTAGLALCAVGERVSAWKW